MAKKAKKSVKHSVKKSAKHSAKKVAKKSRQLKPIRRSPKKTYKPQVVTQPTVDVTPKVEESVVEVKPESQSEPTSATSADAQFQKELTQEPKKGFWHRLFGK